jgi:hypothetical protein
MLSLRSGRAPPAVKGLVTADEDGRLRSARAVRYLSSPTLPLLVPGLLALMAGTTGPGVVSSHVAPLAEVAVL